MKNLKYLSLLTVLIQYTCFANQANQTVDRVLNTTDKLLSYAKHVKKNNTIKVNYTFEVVNNSPDLIYGITIGQKSLLNEEPFIYIDNYNPNDLVFQKPMPSWLAATENLPESLMFSLVWRSPDIYNDAFSLLPNKKYGGFGVEFPNRYSPLWSTVAWFEIDKSWENKIVTLTKGDMVKPTGSVNATVSATPLKTGFYTATLKVTAKDNYDPLPEIALTAVKEVSSGASASPFNASSYTVNTPNNATTGAYPTAITFKADVKVAKRYQLLYAITDASDNKTEVSTVITVPKR